MNTSLFQPLPPDAVAGTTWGPFRYRRYPVFSLPWLRGRFVVSATAVVLYAVFSGLGQLAAGNTWENAAAVAGYFALGVLGMFTIGPALATWVRHQGFNRRLETWRVIFAVILGFAGGMIADAWASSQMKRPMGMKEVPASKRKISDLDEATLRLGALVGGFGYFACGGGLASLAYFSEQRRLRARTATLARLESDMRLTVLQAQIEPHFLFNTLASIRPLIRQDASRAESALDALAAHLRAVIPQMRTSGTVTSTLGQQADICASYLDLMKVRMGERLRVEINVPPDLRAQPFPPLILLSLVENGIKHGIEPKPGPGKIILKASIAGAELQVSVIDDGVGLKDGLSGGLGLANVREQLEMRYQTAARLSIATHAEGGTMAEIVIPVQYPPA